MSPRLQTDVDMDEEYENSKCLVNVCESIEKGTLGLSVAPRRPLWLRPRVCLCNWARALALGLAIPVAFWLPGYLIENVRVTHESRLIL